MTQADIDNQPPAPPREAMGPLKSWTLIASLAVSLLCPVFFAFAGLGTKFGLWDWQFGLIELTINWGPKLLIGALLLAIVTLIVQLIGSPRRGVLIALVTLFIPLLMLGRAHMVRSMTAALPPIHDLQTDWERPIAPPADLVSKRADMGWNPILDDPVVPEGVAGRWPDFAGRRVAELQAEAYPDLKPQLIPFPPDEVLEFAEGIAMKQGWRIINVDAENRIIHAADTTMWFGFTDDVLIRVSPQGAQGSRIDVRSTSRVGLSDMGANAKRMKGFIDDAMMAVRKLAVEVE